MLFKETLESNSKVDHQIHKGFEDKASSTRRSENQVPGHCYLPFHPQEDHCLTPESFYHLFLPEYFAVRKVFIQIFFGQCPANRFWLR
ncbi:hypothetical protein HPP92_003956 [Vanilla planifolia]|uniref:Uncharacterized protein n=1 Tax=Vanilla planifolia TaxID=51239 RepID=A0A835RVF1_VANPL|nr:hypothetical protein HPP92_003956 [Vanilla planifolia]